MGELVFSQISTLRSIPRVVANRLLCGCAACLTILLLCGLSFSWARESFAASFSIDLDQPFAEVVAAVDDVAHSGTIKGTFEYRGDEQLSGAQFQENSRLFPAWS